MADSFSQQLFYLVITNVSKPKNVHKLLELALAFDCHVLMCGQKNFTIGSLPSALKSVVQSISLQRFERWEQLVSYMEQQEIRLIGIEIHPDALSLDEFVATSLPTKTALLPGNEGTGLLAKHMRDCKGFVRIPQYGTGTASLNIYVATSIVLHRCTTHRKSSNNPS